MIALQVAWGVIIAFCTIVIGTLLLFGWFDGLVDLVIGHMVKRKEPGKDGV